MSERTLKQLVGALIVVVALWGVTALFSGGAGSIAASGDIAKIFAGLDESSIDAVRMSRRDAPVELLRQGGAWTVNGFASDSLSVARFFAVLPGLEIGELVATNAANHDRMGVSDDSATTVEFDVSGGPRTLLIGKGGRRFGTSYARLPGDDDVYLVEGDLRAHVNRRLDDWRSKRMSAVDSSRVDRLQVEREGDAYTLVRADTVWTFEDGNEADANAVRGILSELARLMATGFVAESDSIGALPRGASIVAYSGAGELLAEITLGSGDGDRWGRAAGDEVTYRVSSFRVGRVAPKREDVEAGS